MPKKKIKNFHQIYEVKIMNLEKLCLDIATTEDGDDVKKILENYGLWDNTNNWRH